MVTSAPGKAFQNFFLELFCLFTNILIVFSQIQLIGSITVTVRGLPDAISTFVNLCKAFLPPDKISVQNIQQQDELFKELLTNRQYECITLASQHGYYEHERKVTIQGLAEAMNIARSTFQEHLQAAEEAILRWSSEQLR